MTDLDNTSTEDSGKNAEGNSIENGEAQGTNEQGPPPTNAERAAARAAKEAEKKSKEESDDPDAQTPEDASEEDEEKPLDTSVWGDTGDEVANSVLQTLQNAGVSTEEAKALLWDAVSEGDPKKVDRDALVEKVGKAKATLIMAGVENVTDRNNKRIAEVSEIAHEAAGGKDNWTKATKWARDKLKKDDLNEIRDMLDKGGRQARFAAAELVDLYNADPNNTALAAGKSQIAPDGKSTATIKGISRREYGEMLDKLHRKGGTPAEFSALSARRAAGQKQGI